MKACLAPDQPKVQVWHINNRNCLVSSPAATARHMTRLSYRHSGAEKLFLKPQAREQSSVQLWNLVTVCNRRDARTWLQLRRHLFTLIPWILFSKQFWLQLCNKSTINGSEISVIRTKGEQSTKLPRKPSINYEKSSERQEDCSECLQNSVSWDLGIDRSPSFVDRIAHE